MSQEQVELVHRYGEALNAREVPDGLLAPGFVMVNAETAVTDGTFEGAAGVIAWTREVLDFLVEDAPLVIERIVAEQEDCVVATVRIDGTTRSAGMPFSFGWAAAFWCRDGLLTRVVGYLELAEALKAVGLEE